MFLTLLLALSGATVGLAPQIVVHGSGKVTTPPDIVLIDFSVRGEASSSDDAVRTLDANRKIIVEAVAATAQANFEDGKMSIETVRGQDCKMDYGTAVLSTGDCAIRGFVASMDVAVRTTAVKDAATLVGLIGRLKGNNPKVESFDISNAQSARKTAIAAAIKDASVTAEALAGASGTKLGRILGIKDAPDRSEDTDEMGALEPRVMMLPPEVIAPVEVRITPAPIETSATVTVTYELLP